MKSPGSKITGFNVATEGDTLAGRINVPFPVVAWLLETEVELNIAARFVRYSLLAPHNLPL